MNSSTGVGKQRRMRRLFPHLSGKTLFVPLDDSLLAGPVLGLEKMGDKLRLILENPPDALVGFKGMFLNHPEIVSRLPGILNITASTTQSQHTRKCLFGSVEEAVQLGLDAVAVHVNLTSKYEHEMLGMLSEVVRRSETFGMPVLAHMYVRSENGAKDENYDALKKRDRTAYAKLVAHAGRVGVEAGASIVKTHYTGDPDSFRFVVEACSPVPVVIAGGRPVAAEQMFKMAYDAIQAGAGGISFGRNVFSRINPQPYISALKLIVHNGASSNLAMEKLSKDTKTSRTSR